MSSGTQRTATQVGLLQAVILLLVAVTALVHLYMGILVSTLLAYVGGGVLLKALAALFYLNFIGYVVLGTALYLPALARYRPVTRWVLTGYAALTIVCYFVLAPRGQVLGLPDKIVEIVLIGLLVIDSFQAREASRPSMSS